MVQRLEKDSVVLGQTMEAFLVLNFILNYATHTQL